MLEKKHICLGLLAHVDAGKTTLAESILYHTGKIRKIGRVDHKDAFLDTFELEKNRGITIFSKQAELELEQWEISLLDTPGHMDFSAEMERTLQVLDCAILLIGGMDGVTGHVKTLWKLLDRYHVPTFIFMNKMDMPGADPVELFERIRNDLDDRCIDFSVRNADEESFYENIAMCDEWVMESYLESGTVEDEHIKTLISQRKVVPCLYGSALKLQGIDCLLEHIDRYAVKKEVKEAFAARVYKISRDENGNRLTHLKITGGSLKVRSLIQEEKVNQIRIYSGASYKTVDEAFPGMICALTGLDQTYAGQGLGGELEGEVPLLVPVLNYRLWLPNGGDIHQLYLKLKQLEEEDPQLHILWNDRLSEIYVQLMGEVQIEIIKSLIQNRFGVTVEFDEGHIVYRETISNTVEGVGHFEPLRHYAEVHLKMTPGEIGSGLVFDADCSLDVLDRNWQRLILTHLEEKQHVGVLTGSPITDMHITLVNGRAHLKHTEGGDFRQATYRAVRQGLMAAKSVLLEPVYQFRLEVPSSMIGRAMTDLTQRHGKFVAPDTFGEMAVIEGTIPVICIRGYQAELLSYTKGIGQLTCEFKGYEPCHNTEEVLAQFDYDPEADLENTPDSVFCAHGAGFVVPWHQVPEYMHLEYSQTKVQIEEMEMKAHLGQIKARQSEDLYEKYGASAGLDEELEAIFNRTFNQNKKEKKTPVYSSRNTVYTSHTNHGHSKPEPPKKQYLLVDGYNIIFAWDELKALAQENLDSARMKLMDILCNYQGYMNMTLILVFDAYKVTGGQGEVSKYKNIHVVYTKEAETADQYIEKTVHEIGKRHQVTVATSDGVEQVIIMGQGASRLSAMELYEEIQRVQKEISRDHLSHQENAKNYLFEHASAEVHQMVENIKNKHKN